MVQNPVGESDDSDGESARAACASTADMFDVLSETQRQQTLHYLAETPVASLDEIAELIARRDGGALDDAEHIAIALHHGHLPKLAADGLVDYDPDTRTVEAHPALATAASSLPLVPPGRT